MTQDQPGRAQGTGYVARGQVVPDDETEAPQAQQSGTVTRLKKVASAIRGDKPDDTVHDQAVPDQAVPDEMAMTSPDMQNPSGSWTAGPSADAADPSRPGSARYGTTAPTGTSGTAPAPGYGNPADTAAGYGGQADTATDPQGLAGRRPGVTGAGVDEPGTAAPGTAAPGTAAPGTTGPGTAGRHAAADDAGLRPGEATDRLGDFGDIAFGNLLPDAEQYSAQWQQIQFRFVDDPQGSVTEAAEVVSQVTSKLEAAIQERQRAIQERQRAIQERASALRGRWGEGSNADTETLRETLRMYRTFMDQLVGSAP